MKRKMNPISRILVAVTGLALGAVLLFPLWRIDLVAPQYPEGLFLLIYPGKLAGNVDIINGLNHYIGMKTLHASDFPEFAILPYLIGFFALLFLVTAAVGKKWLLYLASGMYVAFGIIAMIDFWRWEYNYGHNLDPDAAIKVPGMSYQPPLIGYKQLLNFSAYSMPDVGGWIFIAAGLVMFVLVFVSLRRAGKPGPVAAILLICAVSVLSFTSCNTQAEPIRVGVDNCIFCKMTVSDNRFGAEIVTRKGKVLKFDDVHCLREYYHTLSQDTAGAALYIVNYNGNHELLNARNAVLLQSEQLHSPMGGNVAGFSNTIQCQQVQLQTGGSIISINGLLQP